MDYLVAISIGPVQEFIAAARKTRDLWRGSALLCEVVRAVARHLRDEKNARFELIFPTEEALYPVADTQDIYPPVANRILAIARSPVKDMDKLLVGARRAARQELERAYARVLGLGQVKRCKAFLDSRTFHHQIDTFLEFACAWVAYEESGDEEAYARARTRVERLLAARKALREFEQPSGRPGIPKSALDPSRDSVVFLPDDPSKRSEVTRLLGLRPGEQLDGISLIKRLDRPRRFVSVARVAADPFIRRLGKSCSGDLEQLLTIARDLDDKECRAVERFATGKGSGLEHYAVFPFDTQLWYEDGARDPEIDLSQREAAQKFFQTVQTAVGKLKIPGVPSYLAVLAADGDRMGQVLRKRRTPDNHREFSKALTKFAAKAGSIVAEHHGALVYSGGDDVLAFLPLDQALPCADSLRRAFASELGESGASLSVGIAVGHYSEPLDLLLRWARGAEHTAKEPRNALAVALYARSGGSAITVVRPWTDEPLSAWQRWVDWHRGDRLPDGCAYELRRLARELDGLGVAETEVGLLAEAEARRILTRKRAGHGREPLADEQVESVLGAIRAAVAHNPCHATAELRRIADEIIIARRIAGVVEVAEGDAVATRVGGCPT